MQAVVLAGGEGTRLRPLTTTQPKPAVRLVDRPFIRFMVDWLARHGVDEVVMACGFRAELLRAALGDAVPAGPSIRYLEEPEPLGTAGPIRFAADQGLLADRFLVLNGDLLTDLDLGLLLETHEEAGAVATIGLHPVDDPSPYGLVRHAAGGEVTEFVEKPRPSEIDTDEVNAGAYVLQRRVAELIPAGRSVSIEREIFPKLVGGGLFARRLEGYWVDIGTPERYLRASWDILEGRVVTEVAGRVGPGGLLIEDGAAVDGSASIAGPGLVEAGCTIGAGARVGPRAVVGRRSSVGERASVATAVLDRECEIGAGAAVAGAILAAGVRVGERARIGSGAVVGEGATIAAGVELDAGGRVEPGARVNA
jgi:mannose-1-phosphate guanylyltransferase